LRGDIALFLGLVAVIGGGIVVAVIFIFGDTEATAITPAITPWHRWATAIYRRRASRRRTPAWPR